MGIFNGSNDRDFYRLVGVRVGVKVLIGFEVVIECCSEKKRKNKVLASLVVIVPYDETEQEL